MPSTTPRTAQTNLYTGLLPATLSLGSYSDLKLSADANSVVLAEKHLTTAINYLEENNITTSFIMPSA